MNSSIRIAAFLTASTLGALATLAAAKPPASPAPAAIPAATPAANSPAAKPASKPAEINPVDGKNAKESKTMATALSYTVKDIDGKDVNLAEAYKGKVVLVVNVASKCGYTKQYAGLQKLYAEKKDKGLVILGFPANDFNGQEPGSDKEIKEFCSSKFAVTFPMFSKVSVKGKDAAPMFKALTEAPTGGAPKWNFTKYLVDSEGKLVAKYDSAVAPDDKALNAKIDELLAAKPVDGQKAEPAKAGA